MADAAKRHATYDDVISAPEHHIAEILGGELFTQPRPAPAHAWAVTALAGDLQGPFMRGRGGPGGWIILFEPELHLGGDVVVPDLAGWRRARGPKLDRAAVDVAPDWVCEVMSPSTAASDRARKMPIYARERVSFLWLVEPPARRVEAFRLTDGRWTVVGTWADAARVRVPPFDAVEIDFAALWGQ